MHLVLRAVLFAALGSFVWISPAWAQSSQSSRGTTSSSRTSASGARSTGSASSSRLGTPASSQTSQASAVQSSLDSRINQLMPSDEGSRSSRGAQDFVGADRGDVQNLTGYSDSSQTQRSTRGTMSTNRSYGRQSTANRSYRQSREAANGRRRLGTAATEVRPVLRLGFEYAATASPNLGADLAAKLYRRSEAFSGTQVELNSGVVILTGTAASEHARALAEQLLALEPGVRRVENRVVVVSPAHSAAGQPAQP